MKIGPFKFGNTTAEILAHVIAGVGPQMFLIIDPEGAHEAHVLSMADALLLANQIKIAAMALEDLQQRPHNKRKSA